MKIVIAGAGEVGSHLAKMLSNEANEITVIDSDGERLEVLRSHTDVITVEGNPSAIHILHEAGVATADLFIAVSPSESQDVNIVSAMLAKKMGCKKATARINNEEYLSYENKYLFTEMGIDLLFYPEKIAAKGVNVENRIVSGTLIYGNRTLLYTILRNMVENSLKYAGDGITLHLEYTGFTDKYISLTYYDTGAGVADSHLERIFERFYRVSEGRTRDDGGSGLGLSIVKNAVAFHGGTIKAKNRPEGGLQFLFSLQRRSES